MPTFKDLKHLVTGSSDDLPGHSRTQSHSQTHAVAPSNGDSQVNLPRTGTGNDIDDPSPPPSFSTAANSSASSSVISSASSSAAAIPTTSSSSSSSSYLSSASSFFSSLLPFVSRPKGSISGSNNSSSSADLKPADYSGKRLIQHSGWLVKQGDVYKTWKRRYFVLSAQCLYYYVDPSSRTPKGIIVLSNCDVQNSDKLPNCLEIYNQEDPSARVYYLQADSPEEKEEWRNCIHNNVLYEVFRLRLFKDELEFWRKKYEDLQMCVEKERAEKELQSLNANTSAHAISDDSSVSGNAASDNVMDLWNAEIQIIELKEKLQILETKYDMLEEENRQMKLALLEKTREKKQQKNSDGGEK